MVWLPAGRMGRYAVWAAGVFVLLLVVNMTVQSTMEPAGDARRPWYDLTLVWLGFAAAVAAAFFALIAIVRDRDRAVLTWVALAPAVLVLVFELVFE